MYNDYDDSPRKSRKGKIAAALAVGAVLFGSYLYIKGLMAQRVEF